MDLNGDGNIDILSGSYSRHDRDMAGLFQVLWGTKDGGFEQSAVLMGDDDKPLIIPANRENVTDKICTRPTAVDLNGDGKLDIVSGNFRGTFAVFMGLGAGRFETEPSWLKKDGMALSVRAHSDPFFIDWDGDGDQDLLSGASRGGVFLFVNSGTVMEPQFDLPTEVLAAPTDLGVKTHIEEPGRATRVFAADVNGDGKFDLLIGDRVTLKLAAKVQSESKVRANRAERNGSAAKFRAVKDGRDDIIETKRTGFVWVMYQK